MSLFKLYGNNRGMKLLDQSSNEADIIDTLGTYMGCLDTIDYIIIESTKDGDNIKNVIRSYDDYVAYKWPEQGKQKTK